MNALDLIRWTLTNKRAADDYYAHPTRACKRHDCDLLAADTYCTAHLHDNAEARKRAKTNRAKKGAA